MGGWKVLKIWTFGIWSMPLDGYQLLSCQNWRVHLQYPLGVIEVSTGFGFKATGLSFAWVGCLIQDIWSV